jgi:hypothetical protein
VSQPWIVTGEQSPWLTHIAATENVSLRWHRRIASTARGNARMAPRRRSHRSVPLIERGSCPRTSRTPARHPGARIFTKRRPQAPRDGLTQRAGIAPPHAAGEGLSGATSDGLSGVTSDFISVPASFPDGVPLTRAMIPWPMPEAST